MKGGSVSLQAVRDWRTVGCLESRLPSPSSHLGVSPLHSQLEADALVRNEAAHLDLVVAGPAVRALERHEDDLHSTSQAQAPGAASAHKAGAPHASLKNGILVSSRVVTPCATEGHSQCPCRQVPSALSLDTTAAPRTHVLPALHAQAVQSHRLRVCAEREVLRRASWPALLPDSVGHKGLERRHRGCSAATQAGGAGARD